MRAYCSIRQRFLIGGFRAELFLHFFVSGLHFLEVDGNFVDLSGKFIGCRNSIVLNNRRLAIFTDISASFGLSPIT
jgi:hypothetical protein